MDALNFTPYTTYRRSITQIDEFQSLTEYSYGLAQQLLFRHSRDSVSVVELGESARPNKRDLSFSMGDQQVTSVDLKCEWVPFATYAEREQLDLNIVAADAGGGRLGPVRTNHDGQECVLWPPAYHQEEESALPAVGKKKYSVTATITARAKHDGDPTDLESFDRLQREYLRLAHSLGDPAHVATRSGELLNRSVFLLEWTAFEVFLRSTVHELMNRHPSVLADGNHGRDTITLGELVKLSAGLTDISALRDNLMNREIDRQENGESVHGLLNLLKSRFKFRTDPYTAWYVVRGTRRQTSYNELMELKGTRNVLVHDAGRCREEFAKTYPQVPVRDGTVIVDDEFLLRTSLALRSVAYSVARTVAKGEYAT